MREGAGWVGLGGEGHRPAAPDWKRAVMLRAGTSWKLVAGGGARLEAGSGWRRGGVEQTPRRKGTWEALHCPGRGREREGVRGWEGEKDCPAGAGPGVVGLARASDAERAARAGGRARPLVRAGARRKGPRQASACMCR